MEAASCRCTRELVVCPSRWPVMGSVAVSRGVIVKWDGIYGSVATGACRLFLGRGGG